MHFCFVPLPLEYSWEHITSLFGSKACLGMVRGGPWRKGCVPKSFQRPVRDRKSFVLNRGHLSGNAPELMKIDVLAIGVQCEAVKPEILNTGQNGALGGSRSAPGDLFGGPEATWKGRVVIPEGLGWVFGASKNGPGRCF